MHQPRRLRAQGARDLLDERRGVALRERYGSGGLPAPQLAAVVAILVEVVGGLALVAGFGTRIAALALAAFTLVATFFFHNFWAVPADMAMMQQLMFYKNIAVVGGLLVLAAHGAGAWSVDAKRGS